ncbi:hypothetical protein K439DRAFT_1612832 [Ramaria rubella]|nr:hypothetical protein K439DRAFT_1612832 [Ramaria rubella]
MTMNTDKNGGAVSPIDMCTENPYSKTGDNEPLAHTSSRGMHKPPTHNTLYAIMSAIAGHVNTATRTHAPPQRHTCPAPAALCPYATLTSHANHLADHLHGAVSEYMSIAVPCVRDHPQHILLPLRPVATLKLVHAVHRPCVHAVLNQQYCTLHASCAKNIKLRLEVDIDGLVGHCQRWLIITMNNDLKIQDSEMFSDRFQNLV